MEIREDMERKRGLERHDDSAGAAHTYKVHIPLAWPHKLKPGGESGVQVELEEEGPRNYGLGQAATADAGQAA